MGAGSVQYPEPHMGAFKTAEHPAGLAPVSIRRDFRSEAPVLLVTPRSPRRRRGAWRDKTTIDKKQ